MNSIRTFHSAKIEKSELKVLARKRHSSGISGAESATRSGVSSAGSSSVTGVLRVNSSGTDSTNTSFRSNMNSFDKEEGIWTETEGSHEEYSSSFRPRKFSNKAELNFRASDVTLNNLPKKKLSYIFEQSSDERLCDNKIAKSQNSIYMKSTSEKTSILESNDRNYQSTEIITSAKNNNNNNNNNNSNNKSNNNINNNINNNGNNNSKNNSNNFVNNNTAHNNQFNQKGGSSTDLRNLKGPGSSSGNINSAQSSIIDTVDSRCEVFSFLIFFSRDIDFFSSELYNSTVISKRPSFFVYELHQKLFHFNVNHLFLFIQRL
jgi:hypothetical protein